MGEFETVDFEGTEGCEDVCVLFGLVMWNLWLDEVQKGWWFESSSRGQNSRYVK